MNNDDLELWCALFLFLIFFIGICTVAIIDEIRETK